MNDIFNTYIPKGFGTVNSYLMVKDLAKLIGFLKDFFLRKN